jgi:hypothetical protein
MNDNIFIISDASYSQTSQCAGLGVIIFTQARDIHMLCLTI